MRLFSLTFYTASFADALRVKTNPSQLKAEPLPLTVQTQAQRAVFIADKLSLLERGEEVPSTLAAKGRSCELATLTAAHDLLLALADKLELAVVIGKKCVSKRKIVPAVALARLNVSGSQGIALHDGVIAVREVDDGYQRARVLAHEISHHLLGHTQWRVEKHLTVRREIQAETLAYLLLCRLEVSKLETSKKYIDGYADSHEDGDGQRADALTRMDSTIESSLVLLDTLISGNDAG